MSPDVLNEIAIATLAAITMTSLYFLPPVTWYAISSFINKMIKKVEAKRERRAYFKARAEHRRYVEDMFRQIR